ncbi:DNA adenine methylase [Hungatella effluvii]|uniref:DNA adenine methylase n=1 Tax=Hungatella effluvii TaxID=1096246 RepID=UPI0022DF0447|nr:DNA adenine methylase [Hungatella effluvii]
MFRYIGNKTKLLGEIINKTTELIGTQGIVADLMAGTGSVALEYRRRGYQVIASDMMTYSKCHLITQLLYTQPPEFAGIVREAAEMPGTNSYERVLSFLNALPPIKGYFYEEFSPEGTPVNGCPSRKYFTSENAQKIDAIREKLRFWKENGLIDEKEDAVLKHTLIMAVNNVANISGTYGYFMADFSQSANERIDLRAVAFEEGNTNHTVLQGFAEELASEITADLCYIDPPYIKRQYAANYHILETIARGDYPEARGKSGLRNWWDQHSKFCTKTRIQESFRSILKEMNCPHFLVSYSEDGLLSMEQMESLFSEFGQVVINELDYTRFRSNNSALPKTITEYLIEVHKV